MNSPTTKRRSIKDAFALTGKNQDPSKALSSTPPQQIKEAYHENNLNVFSLRRYFHRSINS